MGDGGTGILPVKQPDHGNAFSQHMWPKKKDLWLR